MTSNVIKVKSIKFSKTPNAVEKEKKSHDCKCSQKSIKFIMTANAVKLKITTHVMRGNKWQNSNQLQSS